MTSATKDRSFDYVGIDGDGKRSKGKIEGRDESGVAAALLQQGITPMSVSETGTGLNREISIPGLNNRVALKDLAVFSRQFATMTTSGLSLLRSLSTLEEQTERPALKKAVRDVRRDIEGGDSLSGALSKHDKVFPQLMIAMVRAGETGGFLDAALERIAINFEKESELRAKIKSALTYPVIVLCFSVLMVAGVLIFIVPIFKNMFKSLGGAQLPLPTRILVDVSSQMIWLFPLCVIALLSLIAWIKRETRRNDAFRLRFDRLKLRLPVFGKLFTKIAISRFSRNLGTLLNAGVPIMQALDIVGATSGSAVITEAMVGVKKSVRDGQPMSSSLGDHPMFPSMVVNMIQVGEESGQISTMLEKISDFYDLEVQTATEQLSAAIEPVMVVLMGSIIGTVVVALYLPMFTVYQHVQGANG
ncbi:type II secretion system F family protein [Jatrophihabitans sp.]|uniref:type II secretion system F family protein n=1 Tax=Jatrophihabitans sp. TaxID=1932789 RepID=UPI0030C71B72|nr:putative type pilus biosis protein PilC [Jatrophihabitans sp.]